MGRFFNNSTIDENDEICISNIEFLMKYNGSMPEETPDAISDDALTLYLEDYQENGMVLTRLRDRKTNKKISFWTYPLDSNANEHEKELLEWLAETKKMKVDDFYKRNGNEFIIFQGFKLKESTDTILLSSYFSELFYKMSKSSFDNLDNSMATNKQ